MHLKQPRRCTDVLFLLFFVVFWIAMFVLGFTASARVIRRFCSSARITAGRCAGTAITKTTRRVISSIPGRLCSRRGFTRRIKHRHQVQFARRQEHCLKDCPKPKNATAVGTVANTVNWVCDYPVGTTPSAAYTKADWESDSYDYYSQLTATQQATRCDEGTVLPGSLRDREHVLHVPILWLW